jgi:putative flavoprotein involved in K+ transport
MSRQALDCVVVGAGPAGLAASAALTDRGVEHEVLERGRVGESWRTQRWDSFRLNTPGWMNQTLGEQARDAYATRAEVVERLETLAADCPIRDGVPVTRLAPAGEGYALRTADGDVRARTVVAATGGENVPRVPDVARVLLGRVAQYHAGDYRSAGMLPEGAVLVVGSGQSGCQIAEDLVASGRRVVLATSPVGRVTTPYRGRPAGPLDAARPEPADRSGRPQPEPAGAARAGVTLVGRPVAVDGERVSFDASAAANVAAGDAFAERARTIVDEIIRRRWPDAPPAEPTTTTRPST